MPNTFLKLWNSTRALHARFFPENRPPSFYAQWRVFHEEVSEFTFAVAAFEHQKPDVDYEIKLGVVEECADLIVTAIALVQRCGIDYEYLEDAMLYVTAKNDSKTNEVYEVNERGKISRKV